jgi:spore germination cell wall hydrolase CwlJ-like protein
MNRILIGILISLGVIAMTITSADAHQKPVQPSLPMLPKMKPVSFAAPVVPFVIDMKNYSEEQRLCLAKNLYFESRSETVDGMIAVALVTLNRVASVKYPNTICEVVWQRGKTKSGKLVAQFSWTLDGKSDTPRERLAWKVSLLIAVTVLMEYNDSDYDFTDGAMWYHADYVSPWWSKKMDRTLTLGRHLFYAKM